MNVGEASLGMPAGALTTAPGPVSRRRRWLLLALIALPAVIFVLAPWSPQEKAYALCSGICAQQVTHTIRIGGGLLPLDARCTGIYGGFLLTYLYILALGRGRLSGMPPVRILALAGILVLLMGFDGVNSLLRDVRLWHPYAPDNRLRLISGLGAGFGLAILLLPVVNSVLWKNRAVEPILRNAGEVYGVAALFLAYYVTLQLRPDILLYPMSIFLAAAVLSVVVILNLVVTATATWPGGPRAVGWWDLLVPGGLAFLLATVELSAFAIFRFLLEHFSGIDMRTYLA